MKPEPQSDDCNIICPHCQESTQADAEDYSEDEVEHECFYCGKMFIYYTEFSVTHHTKAKETK